MGCPPGRDAGPTGTVCIGRWAPGGIGIEVIAPGLTPRGKGDRVKTDRKDAELFARCLIAGSLHPGVVPSMQVEAARELTRAHEAFRRDLMNARHRVSKMLLRHGRVYPEPSTWRQKHRRWLAAQQFREPMSAFTFADLVACVDGLTARKKVLAERIGVLATDPEWWPTVARLRAFRGLDTLTAFAVHLELGADWARFEKAHRVGSWLGLTPSREQSGERDYRGQITKTGSQLARRRHDRRGRPRAVVLPVGRRDCTLTSSLNHNTAALRLRRPGRRADTAAGTHDGAMSSLAGGHARS
jgi:transposase